MGLISPGGQNFLDFLEVRQVLSIYVGDLRDPLWWPQAMPDPMRVARGPLGIPLPSMPGPKTLCGVGAEHADSFSVLTWILGVLLESPQGRNSSSREGACTCAFLQNGSRSVRIQEYRYWDLWLSHEDFPRGFSTRLSHRALPCATVVGVDPRRESLGSAGKTGPLEWTETSGGLWEWWHDPGVPLGFPVESASS